MMEALRFCITVQAVQSILPTRNFLFQGNPTTESLDTTELNEPTLRRPVR